MKPSTKTLIKCITETVHATGIHVLAYGIERTLDLTLPCALICSVLAWSIGDRMATRYYQLSEATIDNLIATLFRFVRQIGPFAQCELIILNLNAAEPKLRKL